MKRITPTQASNYAARCIMQSIQATADGFPKKAEDFDKMAEHFRQFTTKP